MKKMRRLAALIMCVFSLIGVFGAGQDTVAAAALKKGLVKENGKIYYYKKGKKVKNTLVRYKENEIYFFGSNGAAYKNKWRKVTDKEGTFYYYFAKNGRAYIAPEVRGESISFIRKKIGQAYYGFDNKGHRIYGTYVSPDRKIYCFDKKNKGKYNSNKTKAMRAAVKKYYRIKPNAEGTDCKEVYEEMLRVFGNPVEVRRESSCLPWNDTDSFTDVTLSYDTFEILMIYDDQTEQYYLYDVYSR